MTELFPAASHVEPHPPHLFKHIPRSRSEQVPGDARLAAGRSGHSSHLRDDFPAMVDSRFLEVYQRARNPANPFELRDLWLGRVEYELGSHGRRPELAELWKASRIRREVTAEEVLTGPATVRFVKELFNWFFRDDLYGILRPEANLILSGGSVEETSWGLPDTLKECIRYALDRDWYGYSDSRGRMPCREAIAEYENVRVAGAPYTADNVALTLGGTFAISTLADFFLFGTSATSTPALCGIPNYPPLVEAIARRHPVQLVPLPSTGGTVSLDGLISALTPTTPLVMLQTATNPTGASVDAAGLAKLIAAASPTTTILLDECHEWLGPTELLPAERANSNVVRVSSLSKAWSVPGLKIGWILADAAVIDAYYEYASTTFGGPPSFFYTLVEVLARMERWQLNEVELPGASELAEFESTYGLDLHRLQRAYHSYRRDRHARDQELSTIRDAVVNSLSEAGARVVRPRYSINLAMDLPGWDDSYKCFRDLLRRTGVSVYPGILNFCMAGGTVRVTTARPWAELAEAIERLRKVLPGLEPT